MKRIFQLVSFCSLFLFWNQESFAQQPIELSAYQTFNGIQLNWSLNNFPAQATDIFTIYRWNMQLGDTTFIAQVNSLGPTVNTYSYLDIGPFDFDTQYGYIIFWEATQALIGLGETDVWYYEDVHFVHGYAEYDLDGDCVAGPDLDSLTSRTVRASNATDTFYTSTNFNGFYQFGLPVGSDYQVELFQPNAYYENCDPPTTVTAVPAGSSEVNFLSKAAIQCPYLTVDVGSLPLVRCFDRTYHINYCNLGTTVAEDAYIEVSFDDFLIVNSTSTPWSSQSGNTYTFDLGDIQPNECGTILADLTVSCDAELGQTHCIEAHIYPDTLCEPINLLWDESSIKVTSECDGTEITFIIENIGTGNMSQPLEYIVIEDNVMLHNETFQLDAGDEMSKTYTPNGATYRMEAEQSFGHPGQSAPSTAVEGCGGPPINLGFVVIYSEDDADPFVSIDCRENVGSYDPNDKTGYPIGYGEEHFIERGQDIEYLIRFQNTGTYTAFTVRIEDEIDPNLDLLSLRPGVSSHPYEYSLLEDGTVQFLFNNINLPDSTSNEPESHGFVKFTINQQPDLPLGTEIRNDAAIFFDFNDPIITNETLHTLGEEFIEVTAVETFVPNISMKVFPNPFTETAQFEMNGIESTSSFSFNLYDTAGKLIRSANFENAVFQFNRNELLSGLYFFEISNEHGLVGSGKLMVK